MEYRITDVLKYSNGYNVQVSNTSECFMHRIARPAHNELGAWVSYLCIAQLNDQRHCTDYYKGLLPTETLFEVKEVALQTSSDHRRSHGGLNNGLPQTPNDRGWKP